MGIITIDATSSGSGGVNVNATINNATPGFDPNPITGTGNSGIFETGGSQYDAYGIAPPSGSAANSAVLATGDFTYATGTLSGTLDTLSFGSNLRDGTTSIPSPHASFSGTDLNLASTAFTISDIGLSGSGASNALNTTLFSLLRGTEASFNSYLFNNASNSINFVGSSGADTIVGSINADTLNGNSGNDVLDGGAGNDIINGGAGRDTLTGGAGSDTFVFSSRLHSTNTAFDTITDFDASGVDKIDLDALNLTGGFSASGAASNSAWVQVVSGVTHIVADTDGNGSADFRIALTGLSGTVDASDFIF